MNIIRTLMQKPWLKIGLGDEFDPVDTIALPKSKLALRLFMTAVTILFSLLIVAYTDRMVFEDWRPAPEMALLWLNTAFLLLSSIAMQGACFSARRGDMNRLKIALLAAGAFALAFLAGQAVAWRQLDALPVFDITNPAIAFFYLITGLHALHLLGGLVAWSKTATRLWRGGPQEKVQLYVELCTTYWHFLLIVWLVLFGLLFSDNSNLDILLSPVD